MRITHRTSGSRGIPQTRSARRRKATGSVNLSRSASCAYRLSGRADTPLCVQNLGKHVFTNEAGKFSCGQPVVRAWNWAAHALNAPLVTPVMNGLVA